MNYIVAKGLKIRMLIVLVLFGIGVAGIIARAIQIQVIQAPALTELATRQHRHTVEIQAKRGDILDARGEALAVSREEAQVYGRPEDVEDIERAAELLAPVLGQDPAELAGKLKSKSPFVWLARSVRPETAEAVKKLDLAGIGLLPASRRFYLGGETASHVLGFTGLDGKGLEGIEYFYDQLLTGSPIKVWLERDARGNAIFMSDQDDAGIFSRQADAERPYESLFREETRGANLKLTILRPLQYVVESELEKGIAAANAQAGCVLAMDPATGAVLAMASWPKYDPNRFSEYTQENFRNRCTVWNYEPGSTFKAFTVSGALDEDVIEAGDSFFCENGFYPLGGYTIKDVHPYGTLTVEQIIMNSSNIGAGKIGQKMGKELMYRAYHAFGFGDKTGIDFPGESQGLLNHHKDWSTVAVATVAFGQGVAVTPLQMVTALSAIANGGSLMKPYLVEKAILPDGTVKTIHAPAVVRRVITPETAATVTGMLEHVVSIHGTGNNAAVPGFAVAGKTGTAQKAKEGARGYEAGKYVASFMGFLPAGRPRLAMIVVIDEPNKGMAYGGLHAAPVFQAIAKQAMVIMEVPSDSESLRIKLPAAGPVAKLGPNADPQSRIEHWKKMREWRSAEPVSDGRVVVPDLRGFSLREALRVVSGLPLAVEAEGSGMVVEVLPEPGTTVPEQTMISLRLEAAP